MNSIKIVNYKPHYINYDIIENSIWSHYESRNQKACAKNLHLAIAQLCEKVKATFKYSARVTKQGIRESYRLGNGHTMLEFSLDTTVSELKHIDTKAEKVIDQFLPVINAADSIISQEGETVTLSQVEEVVRYLITRFDFKASNHSFWPRGGRYMVDLEFQYQRKQWNQKFSVKTIFKLK